jgi:hypothetical protein
MSTLHAFNAFLDSNPTLAIGGLLWLVAVACIPLAKGGAR